MEQFASTKNSSNMADKKTWVTYRSIFNLRHYNYYNYYFLEHIYLKYA